MKDFRWFRSNPFDSQLSINPDAAPKIAMHQGKPPRSASGSTTFRALVLATSGLGVLTLAVIACSREGHKSPASAAVSTSTTVAQPVVAAVAPTPAMTAAETKPAVKKAAKKRPEKAVYKNDTYGIAFQYPRRYALKTGDEAIVDWFGSQPAGINFVDGGGVAVAAVELPRGLYPGTDYRDGFFTVSVNRNLSEAQCSQFAVVDQNDSDEEPIAPANVNFGGTVYSQTSAFDGHAFEQAYARYYHVYNNGACYEMALGVQTAGYGAVDGITPVDRDEVFHKLETMLASVRLQVAEKRPETALAENGTPKPAEAATSSMPSADKGTAVAAPKEPVVPTTSNSPAPVASSSDSGGAQ